VLGRREELAAIEAFLAGPDRGFQVLLIAGEIGIGKTTLWESGRAMASGFRVLSARPVESEAPLGFAGLVDLLDGVTSASIDALPAPQRHALRVALLREDVGEIPPDHRSVATATLGVLRAMAADGPVVLAIDDLQWLDPATARVLAFALRRLGPEPVSVLVAARTERRDELPPLVIDEVDPEQVTRLAPAGLSVGAVRELLSERLAFNPSHQLIVRIHEVSGGNPYFALELARMIGRDGTVEIGEQLPMPSTLRRLVHGRVSRLPRKVRDVLLAAALAPTASIAALDATMPEPTATYLESAEEAGIVEVQAGRVIFTHPLLRSVVIGDAPARDRRDAHRRLAAAVPAPIERARHLARAAEGPDPVVAEALDAAARDARLQGAAETAAELGELAVSLTPASDIDATRTRRLAAAEYQFESGNAARARTLATELPENGATLARLAKYQRYCGDPMDIWTATLRLALSLAGDDVALRIALHTDLGMAAMNAGDRDAVPSHLEKIVELAEASGDRFSLARAASAKLWVDFTNGGGVSETLVEQSLVDGPERLAMEVRPTYNVAVTLTQAGDLDRARELLDREYADVLAQGDEPSLPIVLSVLTRVETWSGNMARAGQLADEGMQAAELAGSPAGVAFMASVRAGVHACAGDVDRARADCRTALDIGMQLSLAPAFLPAVETATQLDLMLGDNAAALAQAQPFLDAVPVVEPGMARLVPDAVEAFIRLGRLDDADQRLTPFEVSAATVDRGWAIVAAGRCRGLLLAAQGDLAAAEAELDHAVIRGETLGMPFELARTQLVAGEIHRRARHKRQAHEQLTAAQAGFDALGARVWSARCTAELGRAQLRAAAATDQNALTETERRVATMAAQGHTSREIAAALFTGVRTVEAHLQRVYGKLDVHSRMELSRRLGT
jgi:DNA-binding CsgD family transcriptional regulator